MGKALFIPDAKVRQMVEYVKNVNNFGSLRETVEQGMLSLMRENSVKNQSFDEIARSLQRETGNYLKNKSQNEWADHKAFFDELSGEM